MKAARGIDQYVNGSPTFEHRRHHCCNLGCSGDISPDRQGFTAVCDDVSRYTLGFGLLEVDHRNTCAFAGEGLCNAFADALAACRDDCIDPLSRPASGIFPSSSDPMR